MQITSHLILLFLCMLMFKVQRTQKFMILLISAICLNAILIPYIPFGQAKYLLPISFILSESNKISLYLKSLKQDILYRLIIVSIFTTIILNINSPHYHTMVQVIKLFLIELFAGYFVIVFCIVTIFKNKDYVILYRYSYYAIIFLTFWGIIHLFTKQPIFLQLLGIAQDYNADARFRVNAMFTTPFDYGYVCNLLLFFFSFGFQNRFLNKKKFSIAVICCTFGVFFCGCRTNIVCLAIGIFVYLLFTFKLKKSIRYSIVLVLLGLFSYTFVPFVQDKIDQMLTAFDYTSKDVVGSSIEGRLLQYKIAFEYAKDNLWFGNGLDYFNIDLGWNYGKDKNLVDTDLLGLEGILMQYILERGLIGCILYLVFYFFIFLFFFRNRKLNRQIAGLAITLIALYLSFANLTGELGSKYPTLLLLGFCYSEVIRLKKISKSRNLEQTTITT